MKNAIFTVVTLAAICGCEAGISTPRLNARPSSTEHSAEITYKPGIAIINIFSERGIGKAKITKAGEKWPETVVFHLHLKGLESFTVSNRKLEVRAVVLSRKPYKVVCKKLGSKARLLPKSDPLWVNVEIVPAEGKQPEIPLKDGFFRVTVPKALLKDNPVALNIHWIDFYR